MAELSNRDIWSGRMASWERSGLSRRAWCNRSGVNVHTFDYWRRRLREAPTPRKRKARTELVPIRVSAPSAAAPVELVLPSGVCLRVSSGADVAQVAALVRALVAC